MFLPRGTKHEEFERGFLVHSCGTSAVLFGTTTHRYVGDLIRSFWGRVSEGRTHVCFVNEFGRREDENRGT
jgi:hypothetical protein